MKKNTKKLKNRVKDGILKKKIPKSLMGWLKSFVTQFRETFIFGASL